MDSAQFLRVNGELSIFAFVRSAVTAIGVTDRGKHIVDEVNHDAYEHGKKVANEVAAALIALRLHC